MRTSPRSLRRMELEKRGLVTRGSSSSVRGVQQKWYDTATRFHYKIDSKGGYQGLVEYIVSQVLDCVTFNGEPFPHVEYWLEDLNGSTVTVSKSFLQRGEREISFDDVIRFDCKLSLLNEDTNVDVAERLLGIVRAIAQTFQLPGLPQYYGAVMLLDQLLFNEDRHWGNSAIISSTTGCRVAPMFDSGNALGISLSKMEHAWDYFEPNPYNGDQLEAIPELLGSAKLSLKRTSISFDAIRLALYPFYSETVVDGYLAVLDALLSSCSKMRFANYLEVT